MKIAVIGCGNQGLGFAAQMLYREEVDSIKLLEYSKDALDMGRRNLESILIDNKTIETQQVDASNKDDVAVAIEGWDFVLNATMPDFNYPIMEGCIKAGAHYMDLYSYPNDMEEVDPGSKISGQMALNDDFVRNNKIAVPSVGVNPGWVTLVANIELHKLSSVDNIVIREVEWIDSDEILCSGPRDLFFELFMGPSGGIKTLNGEVVPADIIWDAEEYDFPAPIGKKVILPCSDNATSVIITEESPIPVKNIKEEFGVLSGGMTMPEILLSCISRQMKGNKGTDNMYELFGQAMIPTAGLNFGEERKAGRIRDAAWVSSIELIAIKKDGKKVKRTISMLADLEATLERIPWATPGVLATTALPVEIALKILRGDIKDTGVVTITKITRAEALLENLEERGVTILEEEIEL